MTGNPQTLRDRVVLLLVNGMSVEAAETFCVQSGAEPDEAKQIVGEARKSITVAADYTRDEQIGRAVMRLNDLYAKSIAAQDTRTALQAQRELNRLLNLYAGSFKPDTNGDEADDKVARRQLELITSYLLPLGLVGDHYPVEEHARVASELIRENGFARVPSR